MNAASHDHSELSRECSVPLHAAVSHAALRARLCICWGITGSLRGENRWGKKEDNTQNRRLEMHHIVNPLSGDHSFCQPVLRAAPAALLGLSRQQRGGAGLACAALSTRRAPPRGPSQRSPESPARWHSSRGQRRRGVHEPSASMAVGGWSTHRWAVEGVQREPLREWLPARRQRGRPQQPTCAGSSPSVRSAGLAGSMPTNTKVGSP